MQQVSAASSAELYAGGADRGGALDLVEHHRGGARRKIQPLAGAQHQCRIAEDALAVVAVLGIDIGDLHRLDVGPPRGNGFERRAHVGPGVAQHGEGRSAAGEHRRGHHAAAPVVAIHALGGDRLRLAFCDVGGFAVVDDGQVEHVEPDHGLRAVVAVLVPHAGGRQDQVAATHRAFLALDRGVGALALDDHAHGIGRVAVRGRPFARLQQLHAEVDGRAGLHLFEAVAGIGQHQHAALGFLDRRQFAGAHQQGAQALVGPAGGLRPDRRLARRQHGPQAGPQRHQVLLGQRRAVVFRQVFEAAQFVHSSSLRGVRR
jgi:hypothetical protein